MSKLNNSGSGFFVGAAYGVIASVILFLVLAFLFPVNTDASLAPSVMDNAELTDGAQQPTAPEMEMAQPDVLENSGITLGGTSNASPSSLNAVPAMAASTEVSAPNVETASTGLPDVGDGTRVTTAPTTEAEAPTATTETTAAPAAVAPPTVLADAASGPATEVFAVAFTGDPNKPMLAIILEDTLETSLAPLFETGTPLSFAIPAGFDARESSQSIRQSGYEVVAMVPENTSGTENVAQNVSLFMENVPVAVALLDSRVSGFMLNRDTMQTVLDTIQPAGLGLIAFAGSGDTLARDQALRAGSPFGIVVQTIDETNDTDLIVQALDHAAFDALTRGSAIVFARTKPETIDAIVQWLGGAFAQQLQIVPVSAAIQKPTN